jgi:hypothetical protein
MFNSPNIVPTNALEDLYTIMEITGTRLMVSPTSIVDNWLIGIALATFKPEKFR